MSTANRYLTYRLGDNDFGDYMEHAMRWLVEQYGVEFIKDLPDERMLGAMANHMAGAKMAHKVMYSWEESPRFDLTWYYNYFVEAKIDRTDEGAHVDDDGGCVSVDLATGYIWRH
jgi:hypothetical protein